MNAFVSRPASAAGHALSRAEAYVLSHDFDDPTLVIDTDAVARNYRTLSRGLGEARIYYAVKANPAPGVLSRLVAEGSAFDAASKAEVALCLAAGADPQDISFGNTVKKPGDIAWAAAQGVTLFAADAEDELEKIATNAPNARVFIRVLVTRSQADWPLSRKFGCAAEKVVPLLAHARALGLKPVGLSFHVGSQTRLAAMWSPVLDDMAAIWHGARQQGFALDLLNIGGGFPTFYGDPLQATEAYAFDVMAQVRARFGAVPHVMAEPGRGLVGDAGAIAATVLLVSRKSDDDLHRWVYLDIGKFSGLAETIDEAIRYQFLTPRDHDARGPCVLAGPSCDSADVLYERRPVDLPVTLASGDRIVIRNCGAYTSSYSSVGFNGFPPLAVVEI